MDKKRLTFDHILTPAGTLSRQRILIDEAGRIAAIEAAGDEPSDGGFALPGMPNAHSHCFQRALCGYGEYRGGGEDSFWHWREHMYRLAARITPDDLAIIARQAFGEMLRAGYTSVAEFHYLHHGIDGARDAEMSLAVVEAARDTGIRLRLLPVLYQQGGFDRPARSEQSRFVHENIDGYCQLLEKLAGVSLGFAPHSLRAVAVIDLASAIEAVDAVIGDQAPIHIHISEQTREVEECIEHHGARPLQVLDGHVDLGARWNLVHGTHFSGEERGIAISRGCQVVLCPLTEAYLGDGLFDATEYVGAGGRWAIGSDSNARIDPVEELRFLEYGQRLRDRKRARLANAHGFGERLWQMAADGGAAALQMDVGAIETGRYADLVVLDGKGALAGADTATVADALLIGGSRENVARVFVGGEEYRPSDEPGFSETVRRLVRN